MMIHRSVRTRRTLTLGRAGLVLGVAGLSAGLAGGLGGCDRKEIHSYRATKDVPTVAATPSMVDNPMSENIAAASEEHHVEWTMPEAWEELPNVISMRLATFGAGGLEIAVTAFPGDVGGLVANVNRWRGQVGLEPVDEASVEASIERVEGNERLTPVIVVDVTGSAGRLLGTIIDVGDGHTWFVKTVGASEAVEGIREELIAFSGSFHQHDHSSHAAETSPSEPSPDGARGGDMELTSGADWEVPEEWTIDEDASPILLGAFLTESGGRVTLTALGGEGGGALGNINRWRGQLGLEGVSTLEELSLRKVGEHGVFVDIVSLDGTQGMAAAIVPAGEQTVFFKLTGSAEVVAEEMERFEAFIGAGGLGEVQ